MGEQHQPIIWLRGKKTGLGPLANDLVDRYWAWEQEPFSLVGHGKQLPQSLDSRREQHHNQMRGINEHYVRFTIYDLASASPQPIGITGFVVDPQARSAEFMIGIGDQEYRGRGLGTEAAWLTLDYAFHIGNLQCIYLDTLAPNVAAIRAYEKAGFRKIGERRQPGYWLGEPVNRVLMDAIPADFPGSSVVKQLRSQ